MKKTLVLFVVLITSLLLASCMPGEVEVTITVQDHAVEVEVGDFVTINPTVIGAKKGLSYNSSDELIFTVVNGIISGVKAGSATLTITAIGTDVTSLIIVTVVEATTDPDKNDKPPLVVEDKYIISKGNQSLEVGDEVLLQVLKGNAVFDGVVNWMSNNSSAVTVNSDGIITAVSAGNAKIVAIVNNMSLTIDVSVRTKPIVTVLPTSITINGSNFVNTNNVTTLTVTPNQGTLTDLVWQSSDETLATVNDNGEVTGIASGVVTITAALADNFDVYNTFVLLIKEKESSASPITSITISGAKDVLVANKIKLSVSYTPIEEVATFTFSSSNESVATVDAAGWVMGVSGGVVQITATLVGDSSTSATYSVTVIPFPEGITITGVTQVSYNQNIILQAQVYPVGASSAVNWTTSNSSIASVDDNGRVTGIGVGSATITATSLASAAIKGTHQITVVDQMSITLNPITLNLAQGGTSTIGAIVTAASLSDKSIIWTSSNESVATVDDAGKVTAIAAGTTNIIAKLNANNSVQAQVAVTVSAPTLPIINISNATLSVVAGTTKTLTATVTNSSNTDVTWSTSNASVATVNKGVVTAVSQGSATITVTSVANTSIKATCVVTVTSAPSGSLVVSQSPTGTIEVGASGYQLFVDDSGGASCSRLECTFTSSASTVATVSTYGTISALKAGKATITVTHPTKGTGSIVLTVGGGTTTPPEKTLIITKSPAGDIELGGSAGQVYVRDSNNISVSRPDCTFVSSNASVATVSSFGTITAYKVGSATITVTHPTSGSGKIVLNVIEPIRVPGVLTITASPNGFVKLGDTVVHKLTVLDYLDKTVVNTTCSFAVSPSNIISISNDGKITALNAGMATVTVTHSISGTGTIIIAVQGSTVPPLATLSSWVPSQTLAVYNLGHGVNAEKYLGQTKDPTSSTMHNQEVSVMHVNNSQQAKIIVWRMTPNNYGWSVANMPTMAADYESRNTSMKVIAALNADFFDISANGYLPYQTTGATVAEGENYKTTVGSTTAYKTIGFTNNGTTNTLVAGTPTRNLTLSVYNSTGEIVQTFPVAKSNAAPGAGEVSIHYSLWDSSKQIIPVNLNAGTAKAFTVGNGSTVLANSATDFYGKGTISSTATSTTLGRGQFSVVSNNTTLNSQLAVNTTIRVQYEYSGDFANVKNTTGGTRGFILNNTVIDPAVCKASRSDLAARHPRTLIGKKADGTIVMVAVSGRDEPYRYGVGVEAMQAIMAYYNCVDAYNLDGGGSTTLLVRTGTAYANTSAFTIVNTVPGGTLRSNSNAILIVVPR